MCYGNRREERNKSDPGNDLLAVMDQRPIWILFVDNNPDNTGGFQNVLKVKYL